MSEKTCSELIAGRLAGRLEDLLPDWDDEEVIESLKVEYDVITEAVDDSLSEVQERHRDRSVEGILSIDVRKSYRVLLSWGGPSDGFDFIFNKDGDLIECEYFYQDWFDGAKRYVDLEKADELANLWWIGPEFDE